jgi:hypothetical protein
VPCYDYPSYLLSHITPVSSALSYVLLSHIFPRISSLTSVRARIHTNIQNVQEWKISTRSTTQSSISGQFSLSFSLSPSLCLSQALSLSDSLPLLSTCLFLSLSLVRRYLGLLLSEFVNATFMCKGLFDLKAENATKGQSERTRERAERARTHRMERGKEGESLHSLGSTSLPTGLMWGHRDPYWPNWGHSINEF